MMDKTKRTNKLKPKPKSKSKPKPKRVSEQEQHWNETDHCGTLHGGYWVNDR